MHPNKLNRWILLLALLAGLFVPTLSATAQPVHAPDLPARKANLYSGVTAYDLIVAMNTLRASYGYGALVEDPVIDAVAQSTAEIMAANQMSWHIGNVSGRLQSAGYGGGGKVMGTENFAAALDPSIDEIMLMWNDEAHHLPASYSAYCNVGAGVAKSPGGLTYYVLQAAYVSGKSCGSYTAKGGATLPPGGVTGISQVIVPVKVATPDADGNIYHEVQQGQSLWAIAVAYKVTIKDLEAWNNISRDQKLQPKQKLLIPGPNTKGYATPTPVGQILVSTPDADGKIIHTVEAYQTLSTIAQAYNISVDALIRLNNWNIDWPLQIGQKLVIRPSQVTPSPTPPPLTPVEKLTRSSDGKYYHVVQSGESLSWIASLYGVTVADLMTWNGLSEGSIIHPDQKLLLQVTPPARETATFTPLPATDTVEASAATETSLPTLSPTRTPAVSPSAQAPTAVSSASAVPVDPVWMILGAVGVIGLVLVVLFARKKA